MSLTGYNQILPIIERLPPRDKLRLAVYLIRQVGNHMDVFSSNVQSVLDFVGTWEGDDLDDLLDLVYATRSPVTWRQENDLPA